MKTVPLITVIVPVYNVEKYLHDCIDSILAQTYPNVELILVNDGSKDNSGKICDQYASIHPNITVIHSKNGGQSAARNKGLDQAHGEFIMFVDSDDFIDNNTIETLYDLHCNYGADVVGSQLSMCTTDGKLICVDDRLTQDVATYTAEQALKEMLISKISRSPCAKLYLKGAIGNLRFIEGRTNEDVLFLFSLYQQCNLVCYARHSFYHYRYNPNSTTKNIPYIFFQEFENVIYMESIDCKYDIGKEFFVYKYKCILDICYILIKHNISRQFHEQYKRYRIIAMKNFCKILLSKYMPVKSRIKLLMVAVYP